MGALRSPAGAILGHDECTGGIGRRSRWFWAARDGWCRVTADVTPLVSTIFPSHAALARPRSPGCTIALPIALPPQPQPALVWAVQRGDCGAGSERARTSPWRRAAPRPTAGTLAAAPSAAAIDPTELPTPLSGRAGAPGRRVCRPRGCTPGGQRRARRRRASFTLPPPPQTPPAHHRPAATMPIPPQDDREAKRKAAAAERARVCRARRRLAAAAEMCEGSRMFKDTEAIAKYVATIGPVRGGRAAASCGAARHYMGCSIAANIHRGRGGASDARGVSDRCRGARRGGSQRPRRRQSRPPRPPWRPHFRRVGRLGPGRGPWPRERPARPADEDFTYVGQSGAHSGRRGTLPRSSRAPFPASSAHLPPSPPSRKRVSAFPRLPRPPPTLLPQLPPLGQPLPPQKDITLQKLFGSHERFRRLCARVVRSVAMKCELSRIQLARAERLLATDMSSDAQLARLMVGRGRRRRGGARDAGTPPTAPTLHPPTLFSSPASPPCRPCSRSTCSACSGTSTCSTK